VRAALGHGESSRRARRGAMEDDGVSLYIGGEGEAAAGEYGRETTDDKWGRKWLYLRGV
jgi:hypothetical protein